MANLWYGEIDTKDKYEDLGELAGVTFEVGTTYRVQAMRTVTLCISDEKPTEGGFTIFNSPIVRFELKAGEKVWIRTYDGIGASVNLST